MSINDTPSKTTERSVCYNLKDVFLSHECVDYVMGRGVLTPLTIK